MKLLRLLLAAVLLCAPGWAGTIIGQYQTATGGVVNNATLTFTLSQSTIVPGSAGIVSQSTTCYTANSGQVVGVPDLLGVPTVATSSSGHLPAGTYYVKISYLSATTGEGAPSPERKIALTVAGSLIVSAPVAISNATGYAVYIGTTSGGETLQGEVSGWGNYTQSTPLVAGSSPMASNTSACGLRFSDEMIPTGTYYTVQMLNAKGTRVSGFPQTWCTYGGSGGTVDISRGVPTGSCSTGGVYYPTPILATPLAGAGATQSINGPLDLSGYPLTNAQIDPNTVTGLSFAQIFTCQGLNPCPALLLSSAKVLIGGPYNLSAGTLTILGLNFVANNSFACFGFDQTNSANKVVMTASTASSAVFTGTGTDSFLFICIGN